MVGKLNLYRCLLSCLKIHIKSCSTVLVKRGFESYDRYLSVFITSFLGFVIDVSSFLLAFCSIQPYTENITCVNLVLGI